jgi:glycosyltransferase involved in cell wall biosynthesis
VKVMGLIPALDAGETVGQVVAGAKRYLDKVLVVDDGSKDDTAAKAKEAGANVISHPRNLGKGAALKTGFEYALGQGYDAVLTLDADTQHDPDEIPKLLMEAEKGAGIVIGSRLAEKEKVPPARYYTNMVGVTAISWRARNRLLDSQSGFRVYKAEVLTGMKYVSAGFATETELLIRAGRRGFKIASVPVKAIYNTEVLKRSHYRTVRDTYRICIVFLKSFFWPDT